MSHPRELLEVRHVSVSIARPPREVYAFAADVANLPRWAAGLGTSYRREGDALVAEGPLGTVEVRFVERNEHGVLDHDVVLGSGVAVHNAMRVAPNGAGSEVTFMVARQPGATGAQLAADCAAVERDLRRLKELVEAERPAPAGAPRAAVARWPLVSRWTRSAPQLRSVLRIVAAFPFILSGTTKLFAFPSGVPPGGGTVPWLSQLGLGAALEVAGGALLLLGLFTRPVAFVLAGEMAVAYFQFHFPRSFWPTLNGGIPALLYCWLWLYLSAAGPGPWSLDAWRGGVGARRGS